MKLSKDQRRRISEILGNISVAWFTTGVIVPLFIQRTNLLEIILPAVGGVVAALFFVILSLYTIKI